MLVNFILFSSLGLLIDTSASFTLNILNLGLAACLVEHQKTKEQTSPSLQTLELEQRQGYQTKLCDRRR